MIGLLIDLDGTLYHGKKVVPTAPGFIQNLREKKIPFLFVTNNSSRTALEVAYHLQSLGIEADEKEVYTSAMATAQYIKDHQIGNNVYMIGEHGLEMAIKDIGLELVSDPNTAEVVVQGIERNFNYNQLTIATQSIYNGAAFILTNPDHLLPSDHLPIPGAGALAAAIEAATRKKPTVIGKPSSIIMNYAIERLLIENKGLKREGIIVIGDNFSTDIMAGKNAGLKTALILSGITREDELAKLTDMPDYIAKDLVELAQMLY